MQTELKYPTCDFATIIRYGGPNVVPIEDPCYCSKAKYIVTIPSVTQNNAWYLCEDCLSQLGELYSDSGIMIIKREIFDFDSREPLPPNQSIKEDSSNKVPIAGSDHDDPKLSKKEK